MKVVGWDLSKGMPGMVFSFLLKFVNRAPLQIPSEMTSTEKSIVLYGIARGMRYFHSLGIVHGDLKCDKIFLDGHKYPRIADCIRQDHGAKGGSFSTDVFSYSMIFYEITHNEVWADNTNMLQPHQVYELFRSNKRPELTAATPGQAELMSRMWSADSAKCPTFAEIVKSLEDPDCWVSGTNPDDFQRYRDYMDDAEEPMGDIAAFFARTSPDPIQAQARSGGRSSYSRFMF
jgi:serine/threonine protein kinase